MYLPDLIPSDFNVVWANPSTNSNHQNRFSKGNNGLPNNRKSESPPLSYYTPNKSIPLHMNSTSKKLYSNLRKYRSNLNTQGKADYEGLEHISLNLGSRINNLKEIETWGYNWIKPQGVNKTMTQLIEESNNSNETKKEKESADPEELNDDAISEPVNNNHDETQNNTHLMTENFGHLHPAENADDNTASANNNITVEITNQTEPDMNHNILSSDLGEERDLDAEISNLDVNSDLSDISEYNEYDEAFYEDEEDLNDLEDDDGLDEGNEAIIHDDPINPEANEPDTELILHSSFDHGLINLYDATKRNVPTGEDEYFMACEEYQDDHSILKGQRKNNNLRVVSISESAYSGRYNRYDRRYLDSGNLTTATTLNSTTAQQTTGNTSVDEPNMIYTSDFDMTLE